jgi:uncharacterized membrane protein YcaP (DUF421 family)
MDSVLRATAIYVILILLFRLAGKRTIAQITLFDFILLLVIGEATQQALLGDDFSITNAALVILTLVGLDSGLAWIKELSPRFAKLTEGKPLVLVEHGNPLKDRLKHVRIDEDDILEAARQAQGIERMDQIRYAVLERNGAISIIPEQSG